MAVATPGGNCLEEEEEKKFHEVLCIDSLWLRYTRLYSSVQYIVIYKGPDVMMRQYSNYSDFWVNAVFVF